MNNELIAGYITHSVVQALTKTDSIKHQTLTVWIKDNGVIEQSFEAEWPHCNGVRLIGVNTFQVELGFDASSDAAQDAYRNNDKATMDQLLRDYTYGAVYSKARENIAQIAIPELLVKAAISAISVSAQIANTAKIKLKDTQETPHAFH